MNNINIFNLKEGDTIYEYNNGLCRKLLVLTLPVSKGKSYEFITLNYNTGSTFKESVRNYRAKSVPNMHSLPLYGIRKYV